MTAGRTIDYEALAQDAMRGVVRNVLTQVAKSGLPGDHHFYVSFDTSQPGVSLSKRLKEKYPEEMTIVLQHRFWDLSVTDDRFEVKLTFDGIPERLVVPFGAIKVFFDPSVRYGLQFEDLDAEVGGEPSVGRERDPTERGPRTGPRSKPKPVRKARTERPGESVGPGQGEAPVIVKPPAPVPVKPAATLTPVPPAAQPAAASAEPAGVPPAGGAKVVSLSDFRKK